MAKYLLTRRLGTSYFLQIFVTLLKLRPNSSRRFFQTLLKITKIIFKIRYLADELMTYKSIDSVTYQDNVVNYPTEFLNSLELPYHNLQLKIESPRLCICTRLAVKKIMNNVILLSVCSINLENPCFSHSQLYVTCSSVGIPTKLFIYTHEKKTKRMLYIIIKHINNKHFFFFEIFFLLLLYQFEFNIHNNY
ncbi:ATP-dependent DNA helicase PIF1-like [Aphis craccivora]|uniref:ATP-dependent DNA helicase PIF1-like n=1 Tax=Aphis craccivora TaxID=307492 RepID=A0A6G0ZHA8_APHCR|nr:ATP-dependent DNA helicase PIF1-like [Aphis craccivora]